MKRPRTVFGRVSTEINGKKFKIELRKDALWVRQHHHRREWPIPFEKVTQLATDQPGLFTRL